MDLFLGFRIAAMRADEFWHRDVPKAVLNEKRMVKRVIGMR